MTTFLRDAFTKFHQLAKEEREGGTVQSPSVRQSVRPSGEGPSASILHCQRRFRLEE